MPQSINNIEFGAEWMNKLHLLENCIMDDDYPVKYGMYKFGKFDSQTDFAQALYDTYNDDKELCMFHELPLKNYPVKMYCEYDDTNCFTSIIVKDIIHNIKRCIKEACRVIGFTYDDANVYVSDASYNEKI